MLMERRGIDTKFEKLETNSSSISEEIFRNTLVASRKRSIVNYLLLTKTSVTRKVIRQARKLGMISPTYSWLILNPVSKDYYSPRHCQQHSFERGFFHENVV